MSSFERIESRKHYVERTLKWWIRTRDQEAVKRELFYRDFCDRWNVWKYVTSEIVLGEVGGGPFGGIIQVLDLKPRRKVFIDYMQKELMALDFIVWPKDAEYATCSAELIGLPDNYLDVLLSYNCLDHGWNIEKSIKECIRVAKCCFVNVDCRAESIKESERTAVDRLSHPLHLFSSEVVRIVSNVAAVYDMEIRKQYVGCSYPAVEFFIRK